MAVETVEKVLELYREKYFDLNVQHFHEKLVEEHRLQLSYTWVKLALQGAGLIAFQTWQGRLPQELRLAEIRSLEEANRFLRERYVAEFNGRFRVAAAEAGHAFVRATGRDLDRIFSIQQERTVSRDHTVSVDHRVLQLERSRWRATLAGCRVTVCEHQDGRLSVRYGPHLVGRYDAERHPLPPEARSVRKRKAA